MASNMPLISVIVPVYNGQDFLENCINSILGQTYEKVEIILVNDGSTDQTQALCERLSAEHEKVSVITMDDRGVSAARNAGLERAAGEYIAFVDADDRIHPLMLEVLYRNLVQSGSDIAGCGFFEWSGEADWERGLRRAGEPQEKIREKIREGMTGAEQKSEKAKVLTAGQFILQGILGNDTRCWSKLYRRDVIGAVRFQEGLTIGEDMLFLVDLLPHIRRLVSVGFPGYGYYQNPCGAMKRSFQPAYMDQIRCWEMAREQLEKTAVPKGGLTEEDRSVMMGISTARLLTAVMLTVGKLAQLPGKQRRENGKYLEECRRKIEQNRKKYGAKIWLDRGYRAKILLFAWWPGLYVRLYGGMKKLGGGF